MTTAQLISELEKRGVLTWEAGDRALTPTYFPDDDGTGMLVDVIDGEFLWFHCDDPQLREKKEDCTHSPDDPRLLGRVLLAIIPIYGGYQIRDHGGGAHISIWNRTPDNPPGNWITESGDSLLEAALKALLAKVEGEQSA